MVFFHKTIQRPKLIILRPGIPVSVRNLAYSIRFTHFRFQSFQNNRLAVLLQKIDHCLLSGIAGEPDHWIPSLLLRFNVYGPEMREIEEEILSMPDHANTSYVKLDID